MSRISYNSLSKTLAALTPLADVEFICWKNIIDRVWPAGMVTLLNVARAPCVPEQLHTVCETLDDVTAGEPGP